MTDESKKAIEFLNTIFNKRQQILLFIQACDRYKTEKDTLLPYMPDNNTEYYEKLLAKETFDCLNKSFSGSSSSSTSSRRDDSSMEGCNNYCELS